MLFAHNSWLWFLKKNFYTYEIIWAYKISAIIMALIEKLVKALEKKKFDEKLII